MARTPEEISAIIDDAVQTELAAQGVILSSSLIAEWKLWRDTVVNVDYSFETIQDVFKSDLQTYIDTQRIGTISWWADTALAFQYGDTLLINNEGILYYANIDASKQIIKLARAKEVESGGVVTVVIKVAKIVNDIVMALSAAEMLGFIDYMRSTKIVGTRLELISLPADTIHYEIDVIYNSEVPQTTVEANILTALDTLRTKRGFDPTFYRSATTDSDGHPQGFENAIVSAIGVVAVRVNVLTGTPDGGTATNITLGYELAAGYFNYDEASTITLTPQ